MGADRPSVPPAVYDKAAGVPAPPAVDAASYVLADLTTGEILAARDPHRRLPPASTLKMLTALTLLPRLDPATAYTAVWDDAAVEGSKVGIVPGSTYTVDDLFLGMFLDSGNDAAVALAHAAGGIPATVEAMSATAAALGATDTHVVTPDGLDAPGQCSSAYDLALIARAGLARSDFRRYAATRSAAFPGAVPDRPDARRSTFMIYNQNRLLRSYEGAFGVKTGYTTKAGATFVGAAERGDRSLVVALMRTGSGSTGQAADLLDWGFAVDGTVSAVGTLAPPPPAAVPGAGGGAGVGGGAGADVADVAAGAAALARAADAGAASGWTRVLWGFAGLLAVLALTAAGLRLRVVTRRRRRARAARARWTAAPIDARAGRRRR